jgi:integrase
VQTHPNPAIRLRWSDIDLDARVLMVSHQIRDDHGRTVVCPPKTEVSVRAVALDRHTARMLRRLRARHAAAGRGGAEFVFVTAHGGPLNPAYVTREFRRQIAQAGLPPIRLHDLQHGAASLSLAAGNDLKTEPCPRAAQAPTTRRPRMCREPTQTHTIECAHLALTARPHMIVIGHARSRR